MRPITPKPKTTKNIFVATSTGSPTVECKYKTRNIDIPYWAAVKLAPVSMIFIIEGSAAMDNRAIAAVLKLLTFFSRVTVGAGVL